MTSIVLTSAKGSPGVTTSACALTQAWPDAAPGRSVLLVDADPAGGDVAPGWLRGAVDGRRSILELAASRGKDPVEALNAQLLALDESGRRLLLAGMGDASRSAALPPAWATVAACLPALTAAATPVDVIVDAGRMHAATDPSILRRHADLVVLVSGSSLPAVAAARAAARALRDEVGARLRLLVVGGGRPYEADEVAAACDAPLLGSMPWDPQSAAVFSDGAPASHRLSRSAYARAVVALVVAAGRAAVAASPHVVDVTEAAHA